jgi:hypothetical protein
MRSAGRRSEALGPEVDAGVMGVAALTWAAARMPAPRDHTCKTARRDRTGAAERGRTCRMWVHANQGPHDPTLKRGHR